MQGPPPQHTAPGHLDQHTPMAYISAGRNAMSNRISSAHNAWIFAGGDAVSNRIAAGVDTHSTNRLFMGDIFNTDSNNRSDTVLYDSMNRDSRNYFSQDNTFDERNGRDNGSGWNSSVPEGRSVPSEDPASEISGLPKPTHRHTESAPAILNQATLPAASSETPPSVDQLHTKVTTRWSEILSTREDSLRARQSNLNGRYHYLVTRKEIGDMINKLIDYVAHSEPSSKFYGLKPQAKAATMILEMIERNETVHSNQELVKLCLESHAVAFTAIMAVEKQELDEAKAFDLSKILENIRELVENIVDKRGLSWIHPIRRCKNKNQVGICRRRLLSWLQDFQDDKETSIGFALHQDSIAFAKALFAEKSNTITPPEGT